MSETLEQARDRRLDEAIDAEVDRYIDEKLSKAQLAAPISPKAKIKLRGILRKYAKSPKPFTACVKDNTKRFGPGRTEAICATLKDTIRGNKNWRKGGKGVMAEEDLSIDGEVLLALDAISEIDLQEVFLLARALEEHGTGAAVALLNISGADELKRWGSDGEVGVQLAQRETVA